MWRRCRVNRMTAVDTGIGSKVLTHPTTVTGTAHSNASHSWQQELLAHNSVCHKHIDESVESRSQYILSFFQR